MKQKLLLFLGCMLMVMGMRAEKVTVTFSEQGYENAQDVTKLELGESFIATFDKGSNSNAPKYYSTGKALRLYGGNRMEITAPQNATIISVVLETGSGNYVVNSSSKVSNGTLGIDGTTATISDINSKSVTFTQGGSSGHVRIVTLTVNYSIDENVVALPGKPKFEPSSCSFLETQEVTISCSSDGATIYYTTDGSEPTQDNEVYSSPLEITTTTTVRAIAVNENGESEIAEATYTKIEAMSIAEAKKAYDEADTDTEVFINLENAVVTVNEGDYLFIQDGTTGINLYKSGATYVVGTKFTEGVLSGISTAYKEMHQITNAEFTDVETTTVEVAPIAVTVAQLNADYATYEGRYVKLTDVELAGTTITKGKDSYVAYDRFGWGFAAEYSTPTVCDIEGVVACYEATLQIFPVVITVKEAVLPQVSPAGGESSEEALTVEQGAEIMIVPAENNTVTYSINEAEAIAIAEATTITAENLGEMKLVVTSTFGGTSKTATYYYNVVAATPKITATLTIDEIKEATNGSYSEAATVKSKTGVWSGHMAINTENLQINNKNGYHIQSPVFPGRVISVAVTFASNTSSNRGFVVMPVTFTGGSASSATADCMGVAAYKGESTPTSTATLTADVNSFRIYATGGAIYVSAIEVVYEKPADHVLTVGGTGWATLYLGLDAKIPEGVTCYRVTAVENGVATLKETRVVNGETAGLPAHTAVIVKAEPNTNYTFEYKNSYAYSIVPDNQLKGTIEDKDITAEDGMAYYVLAKPENAEIGLYKATINQADGKAFRNNANKAYLPISVSSSTQSNGYRFNIEGTTAIAPSIFDTPQSTAIYDLTGRRVEKMEKGIYIVNGKKVIR